MDDEVMVDVRSIDHLASWESSKVVLACMFTRSIFRRRGIKLDVNIVRILAIISRFISIGKSLYVIVYDMISWCGTEIRTLRVSSRRASQGYV